MDYTKYLFGQSDTIECNDNSLASLDDNRYTIFTTLNHRDNITDRKIYHNAIITVMKLLWKKWNTNIMVTWYYENAPVTGKLHVHMMYSNVPSTYYGYDPILIYIQHQFHKIIGRSHVPHKVCALTEWSISDQAVIKYIQKAASVGEGRKMTIDYNNKSDEYMYYITKK